MSLFACLFSALELIPNLPGEAKHNEILRTSIKHYKELTYFMFDLHFIPVKPKHQRTERKFEFF